MTTPDYPQPGDRLPNGALVYARTIVTADDPVMFCWDCQRGLKVGDEAVWAEVTSRDNAGFHLACARVAL